MHSTDPTRDDWKRRVAEFAASEMFDRLFKEGMALVEEAASYLDGPGRTDSRKLNRELALVRRALNLARRAGRLLHVPYVTQLAEAKPRTGFFSSGEIAALLEQLPAHLKPVVKFGYLTGWRLREVLGLQWSNVDFEAGEVPIVVLVRDGVAIPHAKVAQSTDDIDWRDIELRVFATDGQPATASFALPDGNVVRLELAPGAGGEYELANNPFGDDVRWRVVRFGQ